MGVLSGLEPAKVFYYFEEITKIPHGSGNVERISDYLAEFARERKLFCIQDEMKNIIIVKEATAGYEEEPGVILQGHMDMVAVKKSDCDIDMKEEGLKIAVDGDAIYAEGTSLGGDDGIAVAYALALLDSDTIKHPKLEVIITVEEEVGMDGAREIDLSMLTGRRMMNLDSEEEGVLWSSCAGGAKVHSAIPVSRKEQEGTVCEVTIGGLLGGHSGSEIHRGRGNAAYLFGRLLWNLIGQVSVQLQDVKCGMADNVIPQEAKALLVVDSKEAPLLASIVAKTEAEIAGELGVKDPDFYMKSRELTQNKVLCLTKEDTRKIASFLQAIPNGVQAMSADIEGLVETSTNIGVLECRGDGVHADFAVRSSVESAKYALIEKLRAVTELIGGSIEITGNYPGWKFRVDSPLRKKMVRIYEEMYGQKPRIEAIHAGLECGFLISKIPDLDCVSFGPNMSNIHSPEETLSISSTIRTWEYLVRLLEEKEVK